jgi:hypothetical protein
VTLAEISRSIQHSAFSIQPAQHFGVVLSGILPSKDAKKKGSQKSEWKTKSGKPTLEPQRTQRSTEENLYLPQIALMSTDSTADLT